MTAYFTIKKRHISVDARRMHTISSNPLCIMIMDHGVIAQIIQTPVANLVHGADGTHYLQEAGLARSPIVDHPQVWQRGGELIHPG